MDTLLNWLKGDLSSEERIWGAVAPALLLGSYFLVGAVVYAIRVAVKGAFHDKEVESRGSSAILGMWARNYFAWVMRPVWGFFAKFEIPPNAVTTLSVLLACAGGVSASMGRFALGGWLYLFAGACDFVDGRLARTTGRASPAGAALDSVLDRYAESAMMIGLAWYYRDTWVLFPVLLAIMGSNLIPYVRARGEGLGVDVKVGLMQRPERLVILGVTVAFSPIMAAYFTPGDAHPMHRLAVVGIVVLAASTQFTAAQRLLYVMRELDPKQAGKWKPGIGRGSIIRNAIAAFIATAADFLVFLLLVQYAEVTPWLATAAACGVGGVINFTINRVWTFASRGPPVGEAWRYTFVSASSALLNSGGVAVLLFLPALDARIAWLVVRVAVFVAWNYPLQRDYVFTGTEEDLEKADLSAC